MHEYPPNRTFDSVSVSRVSAIQHHTDVHTAVRVDLHVGPTAQGEEPVRPERLAPGFLGHHDHGPLALARQR